MANKINIIDVGTKYDDHFTVGQNEVEKILYEKHGYNKGKQGDFPAYVIFFENSNIRRIVPERVVKYFAVEVIEVGDEAEIAPELPQ